MKHEAFEVLASRALYDDALSVAHEIIKSPSFDSGRHALCIGGNKRDGFTVLRYEPGDVKAGL